MYITLVARTGLLTTSRSSASSDTPSDAQARVPTSTTASESCARMIGITSSAYDRIRLQETSLGSLAIS